MIKRLFNENWHFRNGLDNPMASAFVGNIAGTTSVNLPHDAMLSSERKPENVDEMGIGYFTPTNVEYEKDYFLANEDAGKPVYLEFEGVYSNAVLEINGNVVTRHRFGFTGFAAEISDYLIAGETNRIKVSVLNGVHPNGRYYTGTGIYRDVWIMTGRALHIVPDGVRITTLDADREVATLELAVTLLHKGIGHKQGRLRTQIRNADGTVVAECTTAVNLLSGQQQTIRQRIFVRNPRLWNMDSPYLYRYETILLENEAETDQTEGTFGIRTLKLDPVRGLRINGQPVKLKGGCIHSDNGCIGAVSLADAEDRRVRLLKAAGYNALRTAHNPVGKAFLDACDRHGMLVMEEYADAWTHSKPAFDYSMWMHECWEQDIEDMVRVSYNHPSVIMYSIGNEIMDVGSAISASWGRKYTEKFKALDPTRYVTNGVNVMMANLDKIGKIAKTMGIDLQSGEINNMMAEVGQLMGALVTHPISLAAVEESCEMLDVVGYNYAAHMYEMEHATRENRIFVGTETNPPDLDKNWELVKKHPYVLGDFAWTCWDYLGEPGIGRIDEKGEGFNVYSPYPWIAAYCGDFDMTGYRRPVSYWRETVWGDRSSKPYIAVQRPENIGKDLYISQWSWTDSVRSWTWPGWEGKTTVAEVYADADEVELFHNGNSLGRKPVGDDRHQFYCCWELEYAPGILKAVAYREGMPCGEDVLQTAEDAVLTVSADRQKIPADGQSLCFVEFEYRDRNDTLDLSTAHTVKLEVEGVELLGFGSADPRFDGSYRDTHLPLYEGRALAVLRSCCGSATAKVTATDEQGSVVSLSFAVE